MVQADRCEGAVASWLTEFTMARSAMATSMQPHSLDQPFSHAITVCSAALYATKSG